MTRLCCHFLLFFRMWEEHYIIDATLVASDWLDSYLTTHLFDPVKLQSELVLKLLHSIASTVWKSYSGRLNLCFEPDLKMVKEIFIPCLYHLHVYITYLGSNIVLFFQHDLKSWLWVTTTRIKKEYELHIRFLLMVAESHIKELGTAKSINQE